MAKRNYTEEEVVKQLNANSDIIVDTNNKTIFIRNNNTNVGIKTMGKINFLVNYKNYNVTYTDKIAKVLDNKRTIGNVIKDNVINISNKINKIINNYIKDIDV